MANSYERFIEAASNHGLNVRETISGKQANIQTPDHSPQDQGTSVTYNGDRTLVYCHNGDVEDVLEALGLTTRDLFDSPRGSEYRYDDGRIVSRSINKDFRQDGNKQGTALFGASSLSINSPVYVVEGENDQLTAHNVCGVAAVSQAGGSNNHPNKANWSALARRDVVIVQDDDAPGEKRAKKVFDHLQTLPTPPSSLTIVKAAVGKDLSDHIAAEKTLQELIPIGETFSRRRVSFKPATEYTMQAVVWLIDQWLPKSMFSLLAGREGIGKSTIAADLCARCTRGEYGDKMNVAYLASEDSIEQVVKPRLVAAGADLSRVFFHEVTTERGTEGALRLPQDIPLLAEAIEQNNITFMVLDAAKSSMDPKLDGYRDDDVRQFLEPLVKLADDYGVTILGLVHFGKRDGTDTGKLLLGSIAWSQIARSVLSAAQDEDGTLTVTNTKANLAKSEVSRQATIVEVDVPLDDGSISSIGRIEWGDFTDTSAVELLSQSDDADKDDRTDAEAWLEDYLTVNGATPRADVFRAAKKDHVASEATIKRAFKKLGGVSESSGFPRVSTWSLSSRITNSFSTPHAFEGEPTEPTGADLHKRNEPTGAKTQSDHTKKSEPTGGKTTQMHLLTPNNSEIENLIIGALHPEYAMSLRTIEQSVPKLQREEVPQALEALVRTSQVITDRTGKYLLNTPQKDEAA